MLLRAVVGFAAVAALVSLGAWVADQRRSGSPVVRGIADRVHGVVGVFAIAVIALLVVGAIQLLAQ